MIRRDWWLGVLVLTLAILAHALLPRYQVIGIPAENGGLRTISRFDRWTGRVEAANTRWIVE